MTQSKISNQNTIGSVIRLPMIFDQKIETQLSEQARDQYLGRLAQCRQFVERHFQENYGLASYPIFDILLMIHMSNEKHSIIDDLAAGLAFSATTMLRYVNILAEFGLVEVEHNDSAENSPFVRLTEKGVRDLSVLSDSISAVAFEIRIEPVS